MAKVASSAACTGCIGVIMSFGIYLVGFLLIVGGVAWGLVVAGVPHLYVGIACLIMVGVGIVTGVSKTRVRDSAN
jgi:hypothetical protein